MRRAADNRVGGTGLCVCCAIVAASCAIVVGPVARGQAPPSGGIAESQAADLRAKALEGKCSEAELARLSIFQARLDTERRQAAAELAAGLKAGLDGLDATAGLQKVSKCKDAAATADVLLRPAFDSLEAATKELADARCPLCGENREVDCPTCRGVVRTLCTRCNRRGSLETTMVNGQLTNPICPVCRGRRERTCDTCKGRGIVPCRCAATTAAGPSSGPKALTADKARAIGQAHDVFNRMGLVAMELYGPSADDCMKPSPAARQAAKVGPFTTSQPAAPATAGNLPREITLNLGRGVSMKLVLIPAGKFNKLPYTKGPQRTSALPEITITRPFYMGIHEVTQEQYQQVTGTNPSRHQAPKNPVESVSWTEATAFCRKLSALTRRKVSLPTQAQWEYACRAGTTTRYFFGDNASGFDDYGWWEGNVARPAKGTVGQQIQPVGLKKPNPWGLYDMYGNVFEWCSDWKDDNPAAPQNGEDPTGPATGEKKVLRGGSNISFGRGDSSTTTSAPPDDRSTSFGFRVIVAAEDNK